MKSEPTGTSTSIYALVFGLSLFSQCILFHYLAFHSILVSSIFKAPIAFWAFYLPKISICCLITLFVPLFKKKWWTIIVSAIIGIWILSELIYYRINGIFLDAFSFTMIGNMSGFWNGVFAFVRPFDILLFIPTLVVALCYYLLRPAGTSWLPSVLLCLLSVGFQIIGTITLGKQQVLWNCVDLSGKTDKCYNPFSEDGVRAFWGFTTTDYAKQTSVIHSFIYETRNLIKMPFSNGHYVELSEDEDTVVKLLFNATPVESIPSKNLYIILFESFENWSISPSVTPAIFNFIQSHDNILWAKKVTRQTKGGTSADGQMIVNTGILPILSGATCFRFPGNTFPSLSEIYQKSALIQPGNMAVWNQKRMSDAYHITDNFVVESSNDAITFSTLNDIYPDYQYVMAISMASHTPFGGCPKEMKLNWNNAMPEIMRNYLDCVHFTDSCLKEFLERIDSDETLKNSTIIITGDHTIFDEDLRHKFNEYCVSYEEKYEVLDAYCPLIVYSPAITEKTIVDEVTYQMDIFPTALFSIGCDSTYYWKGFGVNLINKDGERALPDEKASILSDKMIQANYWEKMKSKYQYD